MKTKVLIFGILVAFVTNVAFSQSLESQLKVIFGDVLQDSKYKEARIIGRALSTSGNMQSNMEMIQAQSKQEITINLPQNTFMDQNNQVFPNQGYQWVNPNDASDLRVIPAKSNVTLPPYDLDYLRKEFERFPGYLTTLKVLFTYNWVSDMNGDEGMSFTEFNNIKRTFYAGEKVEVAFGFSSISYKKGGLYFKVHSTDLHFIVQIFNAVNGDLIAKETLDNTTPGNAHLVNRASLGNSLPPGKYLIAVSMSSPEKIKPQAITFLREYFEVIE